MKNILLGVCLLLSGCSTFLFYPTKEYVTDLSLIGIPVRDIRLETPDNICLNAWFVPAFDPKTKTETPPQRHDFVPARQRGKHIDAHLGRIVAQL